MTAAGSSLRLFSFVSRMLLPKMLQACRRIPLSITISALSF